MLCLSGGGLVPYRMFPQAITLYQHALRPRQWRIEVARYHERNRICSFLVARERGLPCPGTHAACWAAATERRCGRRLDRLRRTQPAGDRHVWPHRRRCVRYLRVIGQPDPAPRCPAQRRRASAAQGQGQAARSPLALWRGARAVQPRPARPSGGKHGRLVHPRRDLRGVRRDLPGGSKKSALGVFTEEGFIDVHVVDGAFDTDAFFTAVDESVVRLPPCWSRVSHQGVLASL